MGFEGEHAALLTAILWAASALFFTLSGQRVGSGVVNVTRLAIGLILIAITHFFVFGTPYPFQTEWWRFGVLALSAIVGLVIGDGALFYAFVLIGPRLSMLVMSLVPVLSAIFAWICFGEQIAGIEHLAILLTVASVGWVVSEGKSQVPPPPEPKDESRTGPDEKKKRLGPFQLGLLMAFIGALGQTGNLVITKYALEDEFSTLSATEIRILVSLVFLVGWVCWRKECGMTFRKLRDDSTALVQISFGALFGPFLGIWFSYIAIEKGRIGIAATIISTAPVLLIPLSAIFLKEKISIQSVLGTVLAIVGVALLLI